jgi:hypothetical protein
MTSAKQSLAATLRASIVLAGILALPASAFAALTVDQIVSIDGSGTIATRAFSTSSPGELVLAFGASDGPASGGQTVTVAGGGLAWSLVRRANAQAGTSEIWMATAPAMLSNMAVTSTQSIGNYHQSLTVVTFSGATGVGASGNASGPNGAASVLLTTTQAASLVFGVGNDWDRAVPRALATSQTLVHQVVDTGSNDTYWVQRVTDPVIGAGTLVAIADTAPVTDRWNFAAVEIVSGQPNATQSGPAVDQFASADGTGTLTVQRFNTSSPGELIVAFAASDGPISGGQTISVGGAGLTWNLVRRANARLGTSEIWTATASGILSDVKVTSTQRFDGYHQTLTVASFAGAAGVGSSAGTSSADGGPAVLVTTTKAGSLVVGVGNDWDHAFPRTPAANQVVIHQDVDTIVNDTFWVQATDRTVASAGTPVQLADTAPTTDQWNFAGVEILASTEPVTVTTGPAVEASIFSDGIGTISAPPFNTTIPVDRLIAFVASDGPASQPQSVTISGGGLSWELVRRANTQAGTAEIWSALTTTPLVAAIVSSTPAIDGYHQSLTIVPSNGANSIGASAAASAAGGAPAISLTTTQMGSVIYGVGNDWDHGIPRTVDANQTILHQWVESDSGDTFWVQARTAPTARAGATVELRDTTPTTDRWNFAAVEIVDTTPPTITATLNPAPNANGWNTTPVTVHFTCSDGGSGVATCPGDQVLSVDGANQIVSGTAVDNAGNAATGNAVVSIDRTPPALTITSPLSNATVFTPAVVIKGTAIDAVSGIAGPVCNGVPAVLVGTQFTCEVTLTPGTNSITAAATDIAGNARSATVSLNYARAPKATITSPANLTYLNISPTTVTGTVDDASATITINSIATPVVNGSFSLALPLVEGPNVITATASASAAVGTASIEVTLDTTPPHVTITSPSDGFVTTDAAISVAGNVNDLVVGTVNDQQAHVTVSGADAQVANRMFLAVNVPLAIGSNIVQAVGTDRVGNAATTQITVTRRISAPEPKVQLISGNNQLGTVGTVLAAPLVVALTDASGNPVSNKPVIFKVMQNDGLVSGNAPPGPTAILTTDAQGQARVRWTLGMRAGAGGNSVEAYAVGFAGTAIFTATGTLGQPAKIVVDTGNDQIGAIGQPLPKPFIAVVVDNGNNRLAGAPVTFAVRQGGGSIDGQPSVTVTTDSDGRAAAMLTLGLQEGNANNLVEANFQAAGGFAAAFTASGRAPGDPAQTTISGVVLDNSNNPIPGVTMRAVLTNVLNANTTAVQSVPSVRTGAQGQFTIAPAPVGFVKLLADGSTAQRPGVYPSLEYDMVTVAGQNATVGQPIYLLPLDTTNQSCVTATTGGGTLTIPDAPGFSLTFGPGQVTFPGGSKTGCVSVTVVHGDKVPMVPGFGQQPRFIVTIQPAGAVFNPPAPITLPNVDGLKPRAVTEMYSFDHDIGSFVAIGTGVVSDDGLLIRSSKGVGVLKAGWHCGGDPNASGNVADCGTCRICQGTTCINDDNGAFDDGKFCTSCDGLSPGVDCCRNGSGVAKKIEDRDIVGVTPQEWDFTKLAAIIRGTAQAFEYVPGCHPADPAFKGAIKLFAVSQCCEDKKNFGTGFKFTGSLSFDAIGVECLVPSLSVNFLGIVQLGAVVGATLGGEFSGSGTQGPCQDCGWSVDGKLGVTLTGKAVVITKIDPSFLRFEGGVKGDGSVQGSCNCDGCGNFKGCAGPLTIFGTAILANFLSKTGELPIPGTKICVP